MDFSWTEKQQSAYEAAADFATRELNTSETPDKVDFNRVLWQRAADYGVLGWCIPGIYGGKGLDTASTIRQLEGIGYGCRDNALTLGLNGQIWSVQIPLLEFGSEAQKARYLPALCDGSMIAAHGMTEPESGSDAFSLATTADRVQGGYLLNGRKVYIGLSYAADLALIFAKTDASAGQWGISAFLVERGFEGYSALPPPWKMGLESNPLGEIILDRCFVPDANRIGDEGIGVSIFSHAMSWERAFIFASHVGAMAYQLDEALRYANARSQFGQSIGKFQSVTNRLADMKVRLETSQLLLHKLAWLKDQGESATLDAAVAKLHIAESFVENSLDALRIFGARGYLNESGVAQDVRDSLGGIIYSGTSDIQRNIIARLLGV